MRVLAAGLAAVALLLAGAPARGAAACDEELPALGPAPARALKVTDFGAAPDDTQDDTRAIQRALDALKPGQALVFAPGRYLHDDALHVRRRDVTLWGEGANLQATNPDATALIVEADGVSVLRFTLTALTDKRRNAPVHSRLAVWRADGAPVAGAVLRGNRIVAAGPAGSAEANSSSAGGIFLSRATGFLVADNVIERTLADGIHVTGGSRDGRVLRNTVRESGDDMIAVVSYLGDGPAGRNTSAELAGTLSRRTERKLVRNVLIARNDVAGQYWGRGISVVGGRDITIAHNRIADTTTAAAVYLAREANYVSFGVHNVRVEDNVIERVQTTLPRYAADRSKVGRRAGHPAILIHGDQFIDEKDFPDLGRAVSLEGIAITGNDVDGAASGGVGISGWQPLGKTVRGKRADGAPVELATTRATVRGVSVESNRLRAVRGTALFWAGENIASVRCAGNELDGRPFLGGSCGGGDMLRKPLDGAAAAALEPVTGASLSCALSAAAAKPVRTN